MTNPDDIPNRFEFDSAEIRIYDKWLAEGVFRAEPDSERQPFTIVIPPPNVTGALHLGHALNNTLQDIIVRMKRMQGFNALWMPGTDHAGIATQAVVERKLKEEENKSRHDLGREKLVARIWDWKEQYGARILGQLQQMGCSCDWDRVRFTLDDQCARAVRETFFDLFNKDSIYRGKRLVNWDPFLQTAVSDDEVFSRTIKGKFYHLKYPVVDPKAGEPEFVTVATTRPETMLGDTAVAVHPEPGKALDKIETELKERLAKANPSEVEPTEAKIEALQQRRTEMLDQLNLLSEMARDGRKIMLPLMNREIPLVADVWAKPDLGSGCVKITPAHDPNDYEVAKRCDLPMLNVMNTDGTMNAETNDYQGLTTKEARKKVVADLDALELLGDVEDREIELPHSDRSKTPIEPLLADQWFVRMAELAQSAMDAVNDSRVQIFPKRYEKGYLDWLSEKRDWPVSRQLWWGHQIPVWSIACQNEAECIELSDKIKSLAGFTEEKASLQVEPCSESNQEKRKQLELPFATIHVCVRNEGDALEEALTGIGLVREEDVLDTWFSSALWPHSTLGWPEKTPELEHFYPTSTLITSRDIISLWVARMVLMGLNNVQQIPFSEVFIHPKILDGYGETMSKSKGNGIDPLDIINKFGADALRFAMADLTTETQDVRMPVQFECPHCEAAFDQTKKNRELPVVACPKCERTFSTQWAKSDEDKAHARGAVTSERFEKGRNFYNKLWNASRFAMINLEGFEPGPINEADLTVEDKWMLSRLATVASDVTQAFETYRYADASRDLYDFAWDEFCSFYIEMLKDRLADEKLRAHAQRMLAFAMDQLLRLLHPVMPFVTEEIWQLLAGFAPERGLEKVEKPSEFLVTAAWPSIEDAWKNPEIESQFAKFQTVLGGIREIRSRQNLPPRKDVKFAIRCDEPTTKLLEPMTNYFQSMASAELTAVGPDAQAAKIGATNAMGEMDIHIDLDGLIDIGPEIKRVEKEIGKTEGMIGGKEKKLANEKFVSSAPPEIVERERAGLEKLNAQLVTLKNSLQLLKEQL